MTKYTELWEAILHEITIPLGKLRGGVWHRRDRGRDHRPRGRGY
ncbi:hypothetical protein [Corynebacterium rouxii]|uniref:Uncharacterized protein n=1 Tax=Corynebacterium rouxii TaxID=2719119 RepID=A0A6I8MFQ4_9CORY|nr:hypothetical protein [Corynebacterium rouxii]MDT9408119.1 hypothetical protein [Corynebacterium rouxii]MDT9410300.1 hypothetical protein [Corynebacterium rouxii]VZH84407.1 hypothetical protein FRC0190_00429 [Corynebacterium rouxii]